MSRKYLTIFNAEKHPPHDQSTLYAYDQLTVTLYRTISLKKFRNSKTTKLNSVKFSRKYQIL